MFNQKPGGFRHLLCHLTHFVSCWWSPSQLVYSFCFDWVQSKKQNFFCPSLCQWSR